MGKIKLTYWQRRFLQIAVARDKQDAKYIAEMQKRQRALSKSLQKEIESWLDRYADNEGITRNEAYTMLSKQEQRNWSMTLEEFRRKALDGGYEQVLNKEYFTSRITRIEQLQRQLYFEFADTANQEEGYLSNYLQEALNTSYLRHIYELSDRGNLSLRFEKYSSRALELAIRKPWQGSNFSKRVWKNHSRTMPDRLARTMSLAIVNGWGVDRTVKEMLATIDKTLRHRMVTLVQTESAHLAEVANGQSMAETGVERWEWLATLEAHTCDICESYDGKEYDIDDRQAPICPAHPNCRCTKIPVSEGWTSSKRWQRDPETGEGSIGEDMAFEDWKNSVKLKDKLAQDKPSNHNKNKSISSLDWTKHIVGMSDISATSLNELNQKINVHSKQTNQEMLGLIDNKTGAILSIQAGTSDQVVLNSVTLKGLKDSPKGSLTLSHNHPGSYNSNFSKADIDKLFRYHSLQALVLQTSDGSQFLLDRNGKYPSRAAGLLFGNRYDRILSKTVKKHGEIEELWGIITEETLEEFAENYGFTFRRGDDV